MEMEVNGDGGEWRVWMRREFEMKYIKRAQISVKGILFSRSCLGWGSEELHASECNVCLPNPTMILSEAR